MRENPVVDGGRGKKLVDVVVVGCGGGGCEG